MGGEHIVEFAVTGRQIDAALMTAIPGIHSHRVDAGLHQFSVSELHIAVPRIFASLAAQGLHLSEFRTHSATLEDVFVGLTGGIYAMSKLSESSLYQLTAVRFLLLVREPEAIFWIFVFPILLALGLGIAFRNRPADVLQVAATTTELTRALAADKGLTAITLDEAAGTRALATGNILLLAEQMPQGVAYKFDDTNPDARTARLLADRAVQTGCRAGSGRSRRGPADS